MAVLIIFPVILQTVINLIMLSIEGHGGLKLARSTLNELIYFLAQSTKKINKNTLITSYVILWTDAKTIPLVFGRDTCNNNNQLMEVSATCNTHKLNMEKNQKTLTSTAVNMQNSSCIVASSH